MRTRGVLLLEALLVLGIWSLTLPGLVQVYLKTHRFCLDHSQKAVKHTELSFIESYLRSDLKTMKQVTLTAQGLQTISTDGVSSSYTLSGGHLKIKTGAANNFDLNTLVTIQSFQPTWVTPTLLAIALQTDQGPVQWRIFLPQSV